MHRTLPGVVVAALVSTVALQGQSTLDDPVPAFQVPRILPSCGIHIALHQFPRGTRLLLGVEYSNECGEAYSKLDAWRELGRRYEEAAGRDPVRLEGLTVREALNDLVTRAPGYEWRELNGVAVVRPVAAWGDKADVLNLPIRPYSAAEAYLAVAVSSMLQTPAPNGFPIGRYGPASRPFGFSFPGGTLLEALNSIVLANRGAAWEVSLAPNAPASRDERGPRFFVMIGTTELKGHGFSIDTPLARLRSALTAGPQQIRPSQGAALESSLKSFSGHKLRLSVNSRDEDTARASAVLKDRFTRAGIDLEVVESMDARIPPKFSFGVPSNYQDWTFLKKVATELVEIGIAASPIPTVVTDTPTLYVGPLN